MTENEDIYNHIDLNMLNLQSPSILTGDLRNTRDSAIKRKCEGDTKPSYSKMNPGPGAFKTGGRKPGRPPNKPRPTGGRRKSRTVEEEKSDNSEDYDNEEDDPERGRESTSSHALHDMLSSKLDTIISLLKDLKHGQVATNAAICSMSEATGSNHFRIEAMQQTLTQQVVASTRFTKLYSLLSCKLH